MSESKSDSSAPLHRLVSEMLACVDTKQGEDAELRSNDFWRFRAEILDEHPRDDMLFLQLGWISIELSQAGLPVVSRQMLALARIGLSAPQLQKLERRAREQARRSKPPPSPSTRVMRAPVGSGVGVRARRPTERL